MAGVLDESVEPGVVESVPVLDVEEVQHAKSVGDAQ